MDINNFNKFKNPLNSNFTFKVQNKNMTFNNTNKMSLGFNSVNTLREKNFNVNELNKYCPRCQKHTKHKEKK